MMSLSPSSKKRRVLGPQEESNSGRLWELATLACSLSEEEEAAQRKRKGKALAFLDLGSSGSTRSTADGEERRRRMGKALAFFDLGSSGSTSNTARDAEGLERQQMKGKGKAVVFLDVGSSCSTSSAAAGEEGKQRKRKGKAVPFFHLGSSCSTGSGPRDTDGEERQRRMGKTVSFSDLGSSCSTGSAAMDVDGEEAQQRKRKREGKGKDADGERKRYCALVYKRACRKRKALAPQSTSTTSSAAKNNRPYKKNLIGRSVLVGWVEKLVRMGGTRPRLVAAKEMTNTDVNPYYCRLPLPSARRGDPSRGGVELLLAGLSAAEIQAVQSDAGLPIMVLDRWGREYDGGTLKLWAKKWYVVTGSQVWKRVLACNTLRRGDVVEVFSFRVRVLPRLPSTRTSDEEGGPGQAEEDRRLVLVVSVKEEEEQPQWWAADVPRRPRRPRHPRRPQAIA